jgi:excisionase family DNA binding protein
MSDLLSIRDAAKELNLSVYTLRSWIFQRRVPFVRLGRRVAFRREDLETLIEENVVEAKEKA